MATTAQGTTYVESADLVSAYPTASLAVANAIDTKATLAMTQNAQTGTSYTAALTDGYKLVTMSNASANTFTVPPQSSVTWIAGQQLRILNLGAGVCTITPGAGVTINGTPLTLAQHKGACLVRTASDVWTFIPFSGGSAPATVSGTTGSPTVDTSSRPGKTIYTFTGSGSITTTAGTVECLVAAGGGRGGGNDWGGGTYYGGGGGAGGVYESTTVYLDAATHTITVGAGAAGVATVNTVAPLGSPSSIGTAVVVAGGGQGNSLTTGGYDNGAGYGASGGGTFNGANPGLGIAGLGYDGGTGAVSGGGGGGGGSAVGANGAANTGGAGGAGRASTITGASVTYGGGGGGAGASTGGAGGAGGGGGGATSTGTNGTNGTANTGGGGGGTSNGTSGSGGSGVVIIVFG